MIDETHMNDCFSSECCVGGQEGWGFSWIGFGDGTFLARNSSRGIPTVQKLASGDIIGELGLY